MIYETPHVRLILPKSRIVIVRISTSVCAALVAFSLGTAVGYGHSQGNW
jgi:hypothetical protein